MSEPPAGAANDGTPFLPENWNELSPLLDRLLDSPKEERAALLVALSDGNTARRHALEQLLIECETETPLLAHTAARRFSELAKDPADVKPPEMLGDRYRVGRELGRGGMASVYLAHDLKHDRDVAVKIIRSDLSASLGHERFLREIEIAARLRHPNIVPLYDSGQADGSLFFVMPYEEGQSLRERIRQTGALPVADALNVLRDVARALAYAHEHGVVHRDVKPDNVILSGGAAVVTDFGIAKAVSVALTDARDATLTQAGMVIGTPAYMAPEQATADASIDHRADIYSFGCLGYELFAGVPPFEFPTVHQIIAAHIATVPRPDRRAARRRAAGRGRVARAMSGQGSSRAEYRAPATSSRCSTGILPARRQDVSRRRIACDVRALPSPGLCSSAFWRPLVTSPRRERGRARPFPSRCCRSRTSPATARSTSSPTDSPTS